MEIKEQEAVVQQQYLTFFLAEEEYAVSIQKVKEIIEYTSITKVPKVPRWIRGVINLRGNVVPVVDLAVRFGMDERRPVVRRPNLDPARVTADQRRGPDAEQGHQRDHDDGVQGHEARILDVAAGQERTTLGRP